MNYRKWNSEKNILDLSLIKETNWAYSIFTKLGLYKMNIVNETIHENVNNKFSFTYQEENRQLLLENENETICIMEHITVWPTKYHNLFMIFHSVLTGNVYLIDSSGIIYELPCKMKNPSSWEWGSVEYSFKDGYYLVNGHVKLYYRSLEETEEIKNKCKGIDGIQFNKEFNKFMRRNAHNETEYLYLVAGNNKCGAFIQFFESQGLRYEIVPNFLVDDDTVNIRISLDEENIKRKDVQFLCYKYDNSYSIYGVNIFAIGSGLVFEQKYRKKYYDSGYSYSMVKGKETVVYSIIETLRSSCKAADDYNLYKKSLSKIHKLMKKTKNKKLEYTHFGTQLLYPDDIRWNSDYILKNLNYINKLLADINKEQICEENYFELYYDAYNESKKKFKESINNYESDVLAQMNDQGIKISKWKNEVDLFAIVKKEYSDAQYQYHSKWLGYQSLDIYIPSLKVGIEYQGEQHYRPINFFGGQEGYEKVVERDKRKYELCRKNNINLIYWKYDEVINVMNLKRKLEKQSQFKG